MKKISKTTRSNIVTYAMVILAFVIMQSLIAFSFDGILLGSYNIISRKYNWQTKRYANKRKPCRLFLNRLVADETIKA